MAGTTHPALACRVWKQFGRHLRSESKCDRPLTSPALPKQPATAQHRLASASAHAAAARTAHVGGASRAAVAKNQSERAAVIWRRSRRHRPLPVVCAARLLGVRAVRLAEQCCLARADWPAHAPGTSSRTTFCISSHYSPSSCARWASCCSCCASSKRRNRSRASV